MDANALNELVEGILSIFRTQVIRIVLYGSYARGTNTSESDVDIALLLDGNLDKSTEDKLSDLIVDLNLKYDKVFSVIDINYEVFQKWEKVTPFYKNMNKDGIVLWKAAWLIYQNTGLSGFYYHIKGSGYGTDGKGTKGAWDARTLEQSMKRD